MLANRCYLSWEEDESGVHIFTRCEKTRLFETFFFPLWCVLGPPLYSERVVS